MALSAAVPAGTALTSQALSPTVVGVARHLLPAAMRTAGQRNICVSRRGMAPWAHLKLDMPFKRFSLEINKDGSAKMETTDNNTGKASTAFNLQSDWLKQMIEHHEEHLRRSKEALIKQSPEELKQTFERLVVEVEDQLETMSEVMSAADAKRLTEQLNQVRRIMMSQTEAPRDQQVTTIEELYKLSQEVAAKSRRQQWKGRFNGPMHATSMGGDQHGWTDWCKRFHESKHARRARAGHYGW